MTIRRPDAGGVRSMASACAAALVAMATFGAGIQVSRAADGPGTSAAREPAPAATRASPQTAAEFFRKAAYEQMVLSPSGAYLAILYRLNGTTNVGVIDLKSRTASGVTAFTPPYRIVQVAWKTDDRLVYSAEIEDNGLRGTILGAVDRDGRNQLVLSDVRVAYLGKYDLRLVSWLPSDPDAILVESAKSEDVTTVYRVSIRAVGSQLQSVKGRGGDRFPSARSEVATSPGRRCEHLADGQGVVRLCVTTETNAAHRVFYRAAADKPWHPIAAFDGFDVQFRPIGFAPDQRTLYVITNSGRQTLALYEFDPDANRLGRLLFEAPDGVDVGEPVMSADGTRLFGVTYATDANYVHYFEPTAAALHTDLTEAFPKETVTVLGFSTDRARAVVLASSDRSPGRFYLYEASTSAVTQVASIAPWLDASRMATVRPVQFKARDGLLLSGYLLLPPGREPKRLPLVLNPHGGPFGVRDFAGWDAEAQFLATRGYAVLKVNFRGSGGYGRSHLQAGVGQWGDKMQDDLSDAVAWAVREGLADASRVCIFGASYGGYAALMGVAKTPDLYRCAISYVGVTDLEEQLKPGLVIGATVRRERPPEELAFWRGVIGDTADVQNLRSRSPLYNAEKIRVPVFLVAGGLDLVAPAAQSTRMRDALQRLGKPVEYLERRDEGHGYVHEANVVDLYTRIETFLGTHLSAN
jgi:dipeptidyl aminopeptidase/acylaminoacyl peptidase